MRTALIEEIALVTLAHVIFLMHFRSILIVTLPLPLAVLMSFLGMYYTGISSNIMSLAGIAIAIGVLVDAGVAVATLSDAASRAGVQLDAYVEVDVGANRCGVRPGPAVLELARAISGAPGLRLRGLQAYQGAAQHLRKPAERAAAIASAVACDAKPATNVTMHTPPLAGRRRRISSGTLRGTSQMARADEWLKMIGASLASSASAMVLGATCDRSTSIPRRFISRTTSSPKRVRPPCFGSSVAASAHRVVLL